MVTLKFGFGTSLGPRTLETFQHRLWGFCGTNDHGDTSEFAFHDHGLATEVPVGQQTVRHEQRRDIACSDQSSVLQVQQRPGGVCSTRFHDCTRFQARGCWR